MAQGKCDCGQWTWDGEQWTNGEDYGRARCPQCGAELCRGGYAKGFMDRVKRGPEYDRHDKNDPRKKRSRSLVDD